MILMIAMLVIGLFAGETKNTIVKIVTNHGTIEIELFDSKAPITVENFLSYVKEGYFDGTVFHRVIDNFMIQGGGFSTDGKKKPTKPPIQNEAENGISNKVGTIAMARTNYPHSATSQFFINVKDNDFLDYSTSKAGYCVFGEVISGMDVVNEIKMVPTTTKHGMPNWPQKNVKIKSVNINDLSSDKMKTD
ncbi:MAG: peptidylprolyl isomerase [Candidatus Cloacimonadota bacterium]|nr:peptidylprolyl isomerase [Candidatus Cloacimonadota bacterium]